MSLVDPSTFTLSYSIFGPFLLFVRKTGGAAWYFNILNIFVYFEQLTQ